MALVTCPECGRNVSDRAAACPHCGCPAPAPAEVPKANVRPAEEEEKRLLARRPVMFRSRPILFLAMLASIGLAFHLLVAYFGIPAVLLVIWWIRCLNTELIVSNRRTVLQQGVLRRKTLEVLHSEVRDVRVEQTALQRILGVGTITIDAVGRKGATSVTVSGIRSPDAVVSQIRGLCPT